MRDEAREPAHEDRGAPDAPGDPAGDLAARFPGALAHDSHGQSVVYLDRAHWRDAALVLRDEHAFESLVDVTAVDHLLDGERATPAGVPRERFEVVAGYLSHVHARRIRLICQVPEHDPVVPSLVDVYPGASFPEREVYDLMGIRFDGHPELVRILMPHEWEGHPLRKDAPGAAVPVTFKGDPSPR